MRSTLDDFIADNNDLKIFVESIEKIREILTLSEDRTLRDGLKIRRQLDYASFIIVLYTTLENFIDNLAWSYTEIEASRNNYADLCEALKSKHVRQSANILLRRKYLGKGRYTGVTEADVINNLHACILGHSPYKLNRHAVIHHDSNLRSEVIQGIFSALGITNINRRACCVKTMIDWFCESEGREFSSVENVPDATIDLKLQDLVDRRNEVAHGARRLTALGVDEMRERVSFLETYGRSLFDVIANEYLERYHIVSGGANALGSPVEGPFKKGFVVVVNKPGSRLFRGQPLICVRGMRVHRWGEIMELQVNDEEVESVEPDSDVVDVGLRADFKFTANMKLYTLVAKDDVIWSEIE